MSNETQSYDIAAIRQQLLDTFSAETLPRFGPPGAGRLDLDPMRPADARVRLQRLAGRLDDDGAGAIAKLCGRANWPRQ